MKRITLVITLSLVMCLTMAFPASASVTKTDRSDINLYSLLDELDALALQKLPADYKYRFVFTTSTPSQFDQFHGITVLYTNTSVLNTGTKYYRASIDKGNGGIVGKSYVFGNASGKLYLYTVTSLSATNRAGYDSVQINYSYTIGGTGSNTGNESPRGIFLNLSTCTLVNYSAYQTTVKKYSGDLEWYLSPYVPPVDTSALTSLLTQAKAIQSSGHTESSWNALQDQITAAEDVLAQTNKTQTQIDNAKNALQAAIDGLILLPPLPDTTELFALLADSDALEDIGYTSETWTRFVNARSAAYALLSQSSYTESEVYAALSELRSAMDGLAVATPDPPYEPPDVPPAPLGYDLSTGDVSGYLNIVPRIFYNYILSAQPVFIGLFGIIVGILVIPRILGVILPALKR